MAFENECQDLYITLFIMPSYCVEYFSPDAAQYAPSLPTSFIKLE